MRALPAAALACGVLLTLSGCITLRAKPQVPLVTPEPPSRVVMPTSAAPEPLPAPPAPAAPPVATPVNPPATPPSTNVTRPPDRAVPPPTAPPPPEPAPVLQTTANTADLERKIAKQLDSANRNLDRVDRRTLSREAQEQYDWARKFCRQAEDFVKAKSFGMADQYSDKAARIASELVKGSSPTSL